MAFSELRAISALSQAMPREPGASKTDLAEWHEEKAAVLRRIADAEQRTAHRLRSEEAA